MRLWRVLGELGHVLAPSEARAIAVAAWALDQDQRVVRVVEVSRAAADAEVLAQADAAQWAEGPIGPLAAAVRA